ncbi:MAG: MFS transporter [Candidatus Altiarchaeota archaeon]|nr:MFS transporter [Candidatus Altiarchaeota archaeon]
MNELLAILPYKFILAAYSYLPALIVLSLGHGEIAVGFITSVSLIATLFGPVVWSRFSLVTNRKYLIALAYLGMVVGLLLITQIEWIYASVFILSLFPQAAYFVGIAEIRAREGHLGEALGDLEEAIGIVWAVGLLAGFIGSQLLSLDQFAILLASMGILSIPIVTRTIQETSVVKTIQDGVEELRQLELWLVGVFGKIKIKYPSFHMNKDALSLYIFGIIFSFSSGFVFPQLPTLLDQSFGAAKLIYLCVFIEALTSAATFRLGGLLRDKSYIFGYFTRIISYSLLLTAVYMNSMLGLLLFYFVNGISWGFIMMFFEYSGLKLGEKVFGTFLSLRILAFVIASGMSGFMIRDLGFFQSFSIAFGIFLTTFLFYIKFEREKTKVSQEHTVPGISTKPHT